VCAGNCSKNNSTESNWLCRGLVPAASVVMRPTLFASVVAFVFRVRFPFAGVSQFCMLNKLKVSILNCNSQFSRIGKLLNNERSVLKTDLPRNTLRPRLPNEPEGIPKAHGLNQLAIVCTASAALPPCEIVF